MTPPNGLIAEEVAEVYPGLVARSADGQIETVLYQFLPSMLLNEYQKQQRTSETQGAQSAEGSGPLRAGHPPLAPRAPLLRGRLSLFGRRAG